MEGRLPCRPFIRHIGPDGAGPSISASGNHPQVARSEVAAIVPIATLEMAAGIVWPLTWFLKAL
jgi:hypothetical protein